jgi:hypothetical protein
MWYDSWEDQPEPPELPEIKQGCSIRHEWKPVLLLTTTVFNCKFCDMKKEDFEKKHGLIKELFS